MNRPIKAICESRFQRKDGTSIIYIQYCASASKRVLLNTGISIPAVYWNKKRTCVAGNLPSNFGETKKLN